MPLREVFVKRKLKAVAEAFVENTKFNSWQVLVKPAESKKNTIWIKGKLFVNEGRELDQGDVMAVDEFGNPLNGVNSHLKFYDDGSPYYKFFFQTEKLFDHKPTGFLILAKNFQLWEQNQDMIGMPEYVNAKNMK